MIALIDPVAFAMWGPPVVAGIAIAVVTAALSPLVVLKRLSFVGQGISHAAFGGIGIAAVLGLSASGAVGGHAQFLVVLAFCLLSGLAIAWLMQRSAGEADTAIGIVLVGAMALGAILIEAGSRLHGRPPPAWEGVLFGSILSVDWADAGAAWLTAGAILAVAWLARRPLLFWAFDESAAPAFGVRAPAMKYLLVVLLTLAIVTAMKLAGVVLATALLVLPGATALRLSDRLPTVMALALLVALAGVVGGLGASALISVLPPGACMVGVLVVLFGVARAAQAARARAAPALP
ncbi:MAG: metal ABC transporter permease [Phycisphaerales bacterium]